MDDTFGHIFLVASLDRVEGALQVVDLMRSSGITASDACWWQFSSHHRIDEVPLELETMCIDAASTCNDMLPRELECIDSASTQCVCIPTKCCRVYQMIAYDDASLSCMLVKHARAAIV